MSPTASATAAALVGTGLLEDLEQLKQGVKSHNWVDAYLGGVAASMDAFAMTIDPIGTFTAWGFSALIEHVKPITAAFNSLAGDPEQINAYIEVWENIARGTHSNADQINDEIRKLAQSWTGTGGEAARVQTEEHRTILEDMARAAEVVAAIVGGGALLVALVRGLVRDLIAQMLATMAVRVPSWLAAEAASLGTATPGIVAQVIALIEQCGKKILALIKALKSSMHRLGEHITNLGKIIDGLRASVKKVDRHIADSSRVPVHPPLTGRPGMPLRELQGRYLGEHLPGNKVYYGNGVHYLSARELSQHRLVVHDGKLYDTTGKLFDTTEAALRNHAIYVMDGQGNLYASTNHKVGEFHHSSFLAGEPAAGAGHIAVKQGEVVKMNNDSGHYEPSREFSKQVTEELARQGLKLQPGTFTYFKF